MFANRLIALFAAVAFATGSLSASSRLTIMGRGDAKPVKFIGPDDRQQLVVTLDDRDATRSVGFTAKPAGIVEVSKTGHLKPLENGRTTITAAAEGQTARIEIEVTKVRKRQPVSFPNDIVPLFTRAGCNGGSCHGTPSGQNNFRLSLLGFEPEKDHEFLTKETRGRRISPAAPELSLFLQKGSGDQPHKGGVRLEKNGDAYNLIARWIREGLPYAPENDPVVERIEVFPKKRVMPPKADQQLVVTAYMSDGSRRDITGAAEYKPNQEGMASVDENGLVTVKDRTGTTSIMVRFQKHVAVFMATIPLGREIKDLPPERNFIDRHIFAKLRTLGLPPSPIADDSTFLRRVTLDIAGRLPAPNETKQFLAGDDADKRSRKIENLLNSNGYADLFAGKWAAILRNKTHQNLAQVRRETHAFHDWIRDHIRRNTPFDQFAVELVTARGKAGLSPAVNWYRVVQDPKEQMADIAQVFLGLRMQCAQCHHHPYEKWSQDDYYGFAAFFSALGRKEVRKLPESDIVYHKRVVAQMKNPNTGEMIKPTLLASTALDIPAEQDPRIALADWIRDQKNPYFARMFANRYWKHFLGRGLVEPEDDLRVTNPATHPELLDTLAEHFVKSGFDMKEMIRLICNSSAYQLDSIPNEVNGEDTQNYARYYARRLSAEMMLDAANDLTGAQNQFNYQPRGVRAIALPDDGANRDSEFLRVFGRPQMDTSCECERATEANLAQSLHLINSDTIHTMLSTSDGTAQTLARDQRSDEERVTDLYLRALSRKPDAEELAIAAGHLAKKRTESGAKGEQQAFEDIIWVLMNTKEFLFNH